MSRTLHWISSSVTSWVSTAPGFLALSGVPTNCRRTFTVTTSSRSTRVRSTWITLSPIQPNCRSLTRQVSVEPPSMASLTTWAPAFSEVTVSFSSSVSDTGALPCPYRTAGSLPAVRRRFA